MTQLNIDAHVRLTQDLPERGLHRGQLGVVCSTRFAPMVCYEVEFECDDSLDATRAVVMPSQLSLQQPEPAGAT